jgi:hypothetical protein
MPLPPASMLRVIKVAHTVAWAALVAVIFAIPVMAWRNRVAAVAVLTAIMLAEVAVLLLNGWKCPLTILAARYTDDRRANFDIYLPLWLAANNKRIFGTIFVGGLMFSVWRLAR